MTEHINIAPLADDPFVLEQLTRGSKADEFELAQATLRSALRQEALLAEIRDLLQEQATAPGRSSRKAG